MDPSAEPLYNSYENYAQTSATYDQFRTPIGVDIILDILQERGIEPAQARVLDAGCGTGNYLAALRGEVASLVGLEFNPGMLQRARLKLGDAQNVALNEGSILAMPFADGSFDGVLLNQVIHHLDPDGGASRPAWPNLRRALAESHRVLRKGGVLMINTCTQEQVAKGSWYNALVPAAVDRMARRYAPMETLAHLLSEAGLEGGETRIPDGLFGGDSYYDACGPFDKSWRNGDSLWALATEEELAAGLETLRQLHEREEAAAFMREQDLYREAMGQSVTVPAWRR